MENKKETMVDFNLPENSNRSLKSVYLKIIFIPTIIYAVVLAGYFGYINFKVELHSVIMIGILLFIALIFARHNAEYGCCLFEDKIDIFKIGLKDYIMDNLIVVGNRKKSGANFETYADNFNKDLRNDNYASVAAGIFPMLGILGTFISIAISMPNFSSSDINSLESEISQLLGGVGTAFYVSIFGIFLALWWIYFEKKGLSRYQKMIFKYKNATKNFFWDKDEISNSLMIELLNKQEKIANLFDSTFNLDFDKKLNEAFSIKLENFENIINMEKKNFENYTFEFKNMKTLSEDLNNNFDDLNLKYKKALSSFDKLLSDTNSINESLSKQLEKSISFNIKNYSTFEDCTQNLVYRLDELTSSLEKINDLIIASQKEALNLFKDSISEKISQFKEDISNLNLSKNNADIAEELKKTLYNMDKNASFILQDLEKNKNEN